MDLQRLVSQAGGFGALGDLAGAGNVIDNSETVHISSLALLKMLKHGRAGVPMEVMGLIAAECVDDSPVHVVDVVAMPECGTGVYGEAGDEGGQNQMRERWW